MTYKEQREYEEIEDLITQTEQELERVNQGMSEAGSNYSKLQELSSVQQSLENKLDEMLERWSYLSELADKIAQSKG